MTLDTLKTVKIKNKLNYFKLYSVQLFVVYCSICRVMLGENFSNEENELLVYGILNEYYYLPNTSYRVGEIQIFQNIGNLENHRCWIWIRKITWHPNMALFFQYFAPLQMRRL